MAAVVPALAAAGCTGEVALDDEGADGAAAEEIGAAEAAISGGNLDAWDTAVVALAQFDGEGRLRKACSGSLIAPNLVLTAQHCVATTGKLVNCQTSSFGPTTPASEIRVTTSASMWSPMAVWHTARSIEVPAGGPAVCGRDVAIVVLWDSIPPEEAQPLVPRLARIVEEGEGYSAVGFGLTGQDSSDAGLRRRRDELRVTCVGALCTGNVDGREWRGDHGACSGDSGGPAVDEAGRVIGVTSRGPAGCEDPIYGGLTAWRDWIRESAMTAAALGGYEPPDWAVSSRVGDLGSSGDEREFDARWSSCAAASGPSARGAGLGLFAAAAALLAVSRRSARSARNRRVLPRSTSDGAALVLARRSARKRRALPRSTPVPATARFGAR